MYYIFRSSITNCQLSSAAHILYVHIGLVSTSICRQNEFVLTWPSAWDVRRRRVHKCDIHNTCVFVDRQETIHLYFVYGLIIFVLRQFKIKSFSFPLSLSLHIYPPIYLSFYLILFVCRLSFCAHTHKFLHIFLMIIIKFAVNIATQAIIKASRKPFKRYGKTPPR